MTEMMEQTIINGTGKKKQNKTDQRQTGTSQSLRDAWFVGFTSNIVVGVWFGNDDDSPMEKITGGTASCYPLGRVHEKAHIDIQPHQILVFQMIH